MNRQPRHQGSGKVGRSRRQTRYLPQHPDMTLSLNFSLTGYSGTISGISSCRGRQSPGKPGRNRERDHERMCRTHIFRSARRAGQPGSATPDCDLPALDLAPQRVPMRPFGPARRPGLLGLCQTGGPRPWVLDRARPGPPALPRLPCSDGNPDRPDQQRTIEWRAGTQAAQADWRVQQMRRGDVRGRGVLLGRQCCRRDQGRGLRVSGLVRGYRLLRKLTRQE